MRNRRKNVQMGVMSKLLVRAVILISCGAAVTLGFLGLDSKCKQVGQEIHKSDLLYMSLENEFHHQDARWKENLTTEKLDLMISRHGLGMSYPQPHQIVRLDAEGNPLPRQASLAQLQKMGFPDQKAENR